MLLIELGVSRVTDRENTTKTMITYNYDIFENQILILSS